MPEQSVRRERRNRIISEGEANELSARIATAVVDLLFSRAAVAAEQEERLRLENIGRNVRDGWRKYRVRVLGGIGLLGIDLATRFPASLSEVARKIVQWFVAG